MSIFLFVFFGEEMRGWVVVYSCFLVSLGVLFVFFAFFCCLLLFFVSACKH